jgi:DNA polymerase-3 subunit chi
MTEIRFYHLQRTRLEDTLPVMLERCYARGERALVMAGSPERVEALAAHLWTYRPDSFLPHGTAKDGEAGAQPIFLTAGTENPDGNPANSNPNGAQVLILSDGATHPAIGDFRLACELFDGHDEEAVAAARQRWQVYKQAGHALTYFQQDQAGKWEEKARA